jgi:adenosylcobinamide kinase/adenosylcobinamide-phosphate guanylyltransferase
MLVLVTGPVRAGKSTFALQQAHATGKVPVYVATAAVDPGDAEMTARVARHRAERTGIRTLEVDEGRGPGLVAVLGALSPGEVAVVDSLGTWFGALLLGEEERAAAEPLAVARRLHAQAILLQEAFATMQADAVIVAEETGWGLVPVTPLGRIFRDELGRATAALARQAAAAYLVVAGYALDVKRLGRPVSE